MHVTVLQVVSPPQPTHHISSPHLQIQDPERQKEITFLFLILHCEQLSKYSSSSHYLFWSLFSLSVLACFCFSLQIHPNNDGCNLPVQRLCLYSLIITEVLDPMDWKESKSYLRKSSPELEERKHFKMKYLLLL